MTNITSRSCHGLMCSLKRFAVVPCLLFVLTSNLHGQDGRQENPDWAFLVYHGQTARTIFVRLLRFAPPDYIETSITSVEVDKPLHYLWNQRVRFELAINLTRRWQRGHQRDFFEANVFVMVRWMRFPWNRFLKTSMAFGEGVSVAEEVPYIEQVDLRNEGMSHFLNFLAYEITLSPPKCNRISAVYRLHHRSGIFGLVNDVVGGSNVTAFGLRFSAGQTCTGLW